MFGCNDWPNSSTRLTYGDGSIDDLALFSLIFDRASPNFDDLGGLHGLYNTLRDVVS